MEREFDRNLVLPPPPQFWRSENPRPAVRLCSRPAGVSLIIAMIFVFAFMFVSAGLFEAIMRTQESMRNRDISGKVKYLALSAQELAEWSAENNGAGWNKVQNDPFTVNVFNALWESGKAVSASDCNINHPCANFTAVGRSTEQVKLNNTSYYSSPLVTKDVNGKVVGTGNAADACKNPQDANDPCNWNKIYVGQAVDIPLYYEQVKNTVVKPNFNGGDVLKLRIRTPLCKDQNAIYCDKHDGTGRIILYPIVANPLDPKYSQYPFASPTLDSVLVQWMITDPGNAPFLVANDLTKDSQGVTKRDLTLGDIQNTEISGGRINTANPRILGLDLNDFIVWDTSAGHQGKDIGNLTPSIKTFLKDTTRPVLRLNLVTQPRAVKDLLPSTIYSSKDLNDSSHYLPYLEYQVLSSAPFSDSKSYMTGYAQIGDFRKEFTSVRQIEPSLGGFVLGNP